MTDIHMYDPACSGVKVLLYLGEQLLVYRRDNKTSDHPLEIDLPGGAHEGSETPFETLQRELYEEFGLNVLPEQIIYARAYPHAQNPAIISYFAVARLPAAAADTITFGNEGLEYMVMTPQEYLARTDAWGVMQNRARQYISSAGN